MPRVLLCYEATRADGYVWAVKVGRQWTCVRDVHIVVASLASVYRGPRARQPKAYFVGNGQVKFFGRKNQHVAQSAMITQRLS